MVWLVWVKMAGGCGVDGLFEFLAIVGVAEEGEGLVGKAVEVGEGEGVFGGKVGGVGLGQAVEAVEAVDEVGFEGGKGGGEPGVEAGGEEAEKKAAFGSG